ncbi:hypothetical protein ABIB06_006413 [Bradyrhizobium sp. LB8.2]
MTDEARSPLRRRMIEDMTIRKLAPKTQHDHVQRVKSFAAFLGRSPDTATFEDVRRYQLHLTASGVGVPTINQTVSTLRFFFRVTLKRREIVEHIFRDRGPAWRQAHAGHVSLDQLKVMSAIENCRTAALGGQVERCEDCAHPRHDRGGAPTSQNLRINCTGPRPAAKSLAPVATSATGLSTNRRSTPVLPIRSDPPTFSIASAKRVQRTSHTHTHLQRRNPHST